MEFKTLKKEAGEVQKYLEETDTVMLTIVHYIPGYHSLPLGWQCRVNCAIFRSIHHTTVLERKIQ